MVPRPGPRIAAGRPVRPVTGQKRALVMATHWSDATPADPAAVQQATLGKSYPSLRTYRELQPRRKR